ncbi:MAG: hypothetical protein DMF76_10805 [Acidobacteria bacterium]|nr:MAG: hypothetical protein DMF76_10805 [Acidobacteriota bacterium]
MTQPREPNGLVAFHISLENIEERKSIFLIPAAPSPLTEGESSLGALFSVLATSREIYRKQKKLNYTSRLQTM